VIFPWNREFGQRAAEPAPPPFRYRDEDALAAIGRDSAIADLGWVRLTGWAA
jgi:NADH dehydrogenase